MPIARARSTSLALLAAVACCPAQEAAPLPRDDVFGLVRDAEGAPVPGAEVRLLARPMGDVPAAGGADEIEVRTDERGRFRAEILLGRAYTAWAFTKGERGERVSDVVEDVVPAAPVVLDLSATREPLVMSLRGIGRWAMVAPLRWELWVETANRIAASGRVDDVAGVTLPPLPRQTAQLCVLGADDALIAVAGLDLAVASGTIDVTLPLPEPLPASRLRLLVERGGALRQMEAKRGYLPAGACLPRPTEGPVVVGSLQRSRGEPATGCAVVRREHALPADQRIAERARVHALETDGKFNSEPMLNRLVFRLDAVLDDRTLSRLPESWTRGGLWPIVHGIAASGRVGGGTVDVGSVILDECVPLRIVAVAADGSPAAGACVVLTEPELRHLSPGLDSRLTTDRLGRATILLPPEGTFVVAIVHRGSLAVTVLRTTTGPVVADPIEARIRIPAPAMVEGRALDAASRPLPGVAIRMKCIQPLNMPPPGAFEQLRTTPLLIEHARLVSTEIRCDRQYARLVALAAGELAPPIRTDEEGDFTAPIPDPPLRLGIFVDDATNPSVTLNEVPDGPIVVVPRQ